MPLLSTTFVLGPEQVVVRLAGEVDLSTAPQLRAALLRAAEPGAPRVVVDVAQAVFWDCSGLHELALFTEDLARDGRHCRIVRATPSTRRLIGLADFARLLRLDGPLDDPNVAMAADDPLPPPPVRTPRPSAPERVPVGERPARSRRRAFDLLLRAPVGAVPARRWT